MMTAAVECVGGAATPLFDLRRARVAVAEEAEALAAVCRNASSSAADIARAERRLADAYAALGGLILQARSSP